MPFNGLIYDVNVATNANISGSKLLDVSIDGSNKLVDRSVPLTKLNVQTSYYDSGQTEVWPNYLVGRHGNDGFGAAEPPNGADPHTTKEIGLGNFLKMKVVPYSDNNTYYGSVLTLTTSPGTLLGRASDFVNEEIPEAEAIIIGTGLELNGNTLDVSATSGVNLFSRVDLNLAVMYIINEFSNATSEYYSDCYLKSIYDGPESHVELTITITDKYVNKVIHFHIDPESTRPIKLIFDFEGLEDGQINNPKDPSRAVATIAPSIGVTYTLKLLESKPNGPSDVPKILFESKPFAYFLSGSHTTYPNYTSTSVGFGVVTSGSSVAVGSDSLSKDNSVSVGWKSKSDTKSISFGYTASAVSGSISIGSASLSVDNSLALGNSTFANSQSIALGDSTETKYVGEIGHLIKNSNDTNKNNYSRKVFWYKSTPAISSNQEPLFLLNDGSSQLTIQTGSLVKFKGECIAYSSDSSGSAAWEFSGLVYRDNTSNLNNTYFAGDYILNKTQYSHSGSAIYFDIDIVDNNLSLLISGSTAPPTWSWLANAELLEIKI